MEITLELVEQLREKTGVTYAQAKQALEYSGGNMLDAIIYLEERGAIPREEGAYFSTRSEMPPPPPPPPEALSPLAEKKSRKEKREDKKTGALHVKVTWSKDSGKNLFTTLRRWLIDNELEIWRKDKPITALPVLILVLLLFFAYWLVIPVLVVGLFLGFRYRFSGPDLEREEINGVMGSVADTASELSRQVMEELKHQHEKHETNQTKDEDKP